MPEHDLKPTCVHCSRTYRETKTDSLPTSVPVERATIMREVPGRGYLAVVECHGAKRVIELGVETPSDAKVRSTMAFAA